MDNDNIPWDEFFKRVSQGQTIDSICSLEHMPTKATIYAHINSEPEIAKRMDKAREDGTIAIADEVRQYAERAAAGELDFRAARVAADISTRYMEMINPDRFGRKRGEQGIPDKITITLRVPNSASGGDNDVDQ
jgi:hypothetical protein